MAVGDFGSTAFLDTQFLTYTGFVPSNQQFRLVRGAGTTIFVGVSALEISSSDGPPQIVLGTYGISTAGVISPTVITQAQLSSMASGGQASLDAIATDPPGVVIVAWTDRDNTAGDAAKISTYVVSPTGGLTFVQTASLQTDTDVSGVGTLSRVEGNVYLASYGFLVSGISIREFGVSFSITTGGVITIPIDGPRQLATPSGSGTKHSARVRSTHIVNPYSGGANLGGVESHTMTAAGVFSGTPSEDQSSQGNTFLASHILTLDSGLGIVAFNHDNATGDWLLKTALMDASGVLTTGHSTRMGATSIPAFSQLAYLGSRTLVLLVDDATPSQLRTFVSDVNGTLTTGGTITNANIGRGPSFAHVSGNVMAVGTFVNASTSSLRISTFNVANELTANSAFALNILVDWNNDGVFSSTEDISTDCTRFSWRRGREAEQSETPIGTATIELKDPSGDYSPHSTNSKWGSGKVTLNREVLARVVYGETTYGLFRGRIQAIRPRLTAEFQQASLFCVDGMDELARKVFSSPIDGPTSGGVLINGGPVNMSVGTTVSGVIKTVLDNASWAVARRLITDPGSSLTWWSQDNISAKAALDEAERHDPGSIIFVNSSGNIQFYSSTHFDGSTFLARFDSTDIKAWDYDFSARNLINAAQITVHGRRALLASTDVGHLDTASLPDLPANSTFWFTIPFLNKPAVTVRTPLIVKNGTSTVIGVNGSLALVSTGGTTLLTGEASIFCRSLGGSAVRCFINNLTLATARIQTPEGSTTPSICLWVYGTPLTDNPITSTASDSTFIEQYQRRSHVADYPFLDQSSQAEILAQRIVDRYKRPRGDFAHMAIESISSGQIIQILSREIGDKIRVGIADLGFTTGRDYLIYSGEWELTPGNAMGLGLHLAVEWGLSESSGNSTTP